MQIQLKQTEIIAALKQFISTQGISLVGKTVSISFTAGRKEAGIIADLSIEEASIPGFTDDAAEEEKQPVTLSVVPTSPPVATAAEEVVAETPEATTDTSAKTTSLFN